jgi:hypothetical protein
MDAEGVLGIAPKALQGAKDRLCQITKHDWAISLEQMIGEANSFPSGWVTISAIPTRTAKLRGLRSSRMSDPDWVGPQDALTTIFFVGC